MFIYYYLIGYQNKDQAPSADIKKDLTLSQRISAVYHWNIDLLGDAAGSPKESYVARAYKILTFILWGTTQKTDAAAKNLLTSGDTRASSGSSFSAKSSSSSSNYSIGNNNISTALPRQELDASVDLWEKIIQDMAAARLARDAAIAANAKGTFDYHPKGADLIGQMIDYAQAFCQAGKNGEIDIKKTHLPYLAMAVEENFNAIIPKEAEDAGDVKNFRQEMSERIRSNQVTYEWWIAFNMRLSILVTPPALRSGWAGSFIDKPKEGLVQTGGWKKHAETVPMINDYMVPEEYFVFPTHLGDLEINDMNRMFSSGVFAIGLSKDPLMVDGRLMWPDQFFRHDLVHFSNELRIIDGEPLSKFEPIRERFFQMRNHLASHNGALVKLMDFTFFYMNHEVCRFWEMGERLKRTFSTDLMGGYSFRKDELSYMSRSDWYLDHVPAPQVLGFKSMEQMVNFGNHVLHLVLATDTTTANLADGIEKVRQQHLQHEGVKVESNQVIVPNNLPCPDGAVVELTTEELTTYNQIVREINSQGKAQVAPDRIAQSKALQRVIKLQGLDPLINRPVTISSSP